MLDRGFARFDCVVKFLTDSAISYRALQVSTRIMELLLVRMVLSAGVITEEW